MSQRTCPGCGKPLTGRKDKRYCGDRCRGLANYHRHNRPEPEASGTSDLILRAIGDNFYLRDLADELAMLRKSRGARAALEKTLRAAIAENPVWPSHSLPGQCALLLWLLEHPAAEHGRFHHLFEKVKRPGEVKISGTMIHAGIGRVGTGT